MLGRLSRLGLRAAGWRFDGEPPRAPKYVVLGVPHTSNWDAVLLLAMCRSIGLEASWMIKSTWFQGPLKPALEGLGAVAIDRSRRANMVQQMVDEFARRERLVLIIPPEGTRGRAEHWRSGFYRIALGAGVPVAPGYLDYGTRRCGIGDPIPMTGDVGDDMDAIRAFYAGGGYVGRHPEQAGPIRLREEGPPHVPPTLP